MTRHHNHDGTPAKCAIPSASKKNSDTKKAWKNRIREACLNHVRRQSLGGRNTRAQRQQHPVEEDMKMTMKEDEDQQTATYVDSRSLVEAELKLHGVRVVSPPTRKWNSQADEQSTIMMDCGGEETGRNDDENLFVLTEDEVIDLMEDIEREWKQHQEKLLEEEMNRIENEEQALYESIAEYEQWREDGNGDGTQDSAVLCPVCQEAYLTTSDTWEMGSDIVCPNHMDGSCALRLEPRPGLSLMSLKERLAHAISTHVDVCSHPISFHVSSEVISDDCLLSLLWGTCSVCGSRSCLG